MILNRLFFSLKQVANTQVHTDGILRTLHGRGVATNKDYAHITFLTLPVRIMIVEEVIYFQLK